MLVIARSMWLLFCCFGLVAQVRLCVDEQPPACRVVAFATDEVLRVELEVERGYHAYAEDVGGGGPVAIELAADCDFVAAGPLILPEHQQGRVVGKAAWRLPIRLRKAAIGRELRAKVRLQVCDELQCNEPAVVELRGRPGGVPVLLVVDVRDDRAGRIEQFLGSRGFDVRVTTYADVTAAMCERCEVVLADSKRFGEVARVRQQVRAFPRTETPIVAVGFFGTELVEAHGVAMTSGYI